MATSTDTWPDATTLRLSEHFLLSDLIGCNSVYTFGYKNVFDDPTGSKLREGKALAEHVLEPLLQRSRLSVSYGYISPYLSGRIVKYQNPSKPSYHRWDMGAACDVTLHESLAAGEAPVHSAFWIDENLPVSRVITYSESPFICVASRVSEIESGDYRRALYENRYVGQRQPVYISYSNSPATRREQKQAVDLSFDWRGAGYPTYHGGGIRQYQHIRTSDYTVLSDFLYSERAVRLGYRNLPETSDKQLELHKFEFAGRLYDELLKLLSIRRLSIVRGFESDEWAQSVHNWHDGIYLVVVPPASISATSVAAAAQELANVTVAKVGKNRRVAICAKLPTRRIRRTRT